MGRIDMEKNPSADFLTTRVSWAVIIKADVQTVERIKQLLATMPEAQVCFQKWSMGKLWIVDRPEGEVRT